MAHPPIASLTELRRSLHLSQQTVASMLGVGQIQISRLERREDMRLVSLRAYVEALGGQLELVVRLPRRAVQLAIPPRAQGR